MSDKVSPITGFTARLPEAHMKMNTAYRIGELPSESNISWDYDSRMKSQGFIFWV